MLKAQVSRTGLISLLVIPLLTITAQARDLPLENYAQEPRALMALAVAVHELSDCQSKLAFIEEDVAGGDGSTILATVTCEKFPAADGKIKPANVKIEMVVDDKKLPIGPTSFEYNLP